MPFCVQCGAKLEDGAKFCTVCGVKQPEAASPVYVPPTEEKPAEPQGYSYTPPASAGAPWQGSAEIHGSDPITLDASAAPSWMTVRRYGHLVLMKGTPSTAGNVSFTLYAVNLNGTETASAQIAFTVS